MYSGHFHNSICQSQYYERHVLHPSLFNLAHQKVLMLFLLADHLFESSLVDDRYEVGDLSVASNDSVLVPFQELESKREPQNHSNQEHEVYSEPANFHLLFWDIASPEVVVGTLGFRETLQGFPEPWVLLHFRQRQVDRIVGELVSTSCGCYLSQFCGG